ncbi:MAG: hypothetical protein QNJ14_17930 [Woeseiaceae bacterium]|nr:hypothetical protein [Woeseiaceae bacterium]
MTVRAILIAAVLLVAQPALAQIVTKIAAVEASPANLILPGGTDGMVTFRPCDGDCDADYIRVRLSADTRFTVNGKALRFADFRREFATIKRNAESYALVTYETQTNTVTSIQIAR